MPEPRSRGIAPVVEKIHAGVFWFKLGAWIFFALAGPIMFTAMHYYLGVFMTGLISAAIGYFAFGPRYVNFRGSQYLRNILVAQGAFFALYGGRVLFTPATPWDHARAGTRASLVMRADGTVYGVEFREKNAGFLWRDPMTGTWWRDPFPGKFVADIFLSADGEQVIAPEDRSRLVWVRESGKWKARVEKKRKRRRDIECQGMTSAPFTPEFCLRQGATTWIAATGLFSGKLAVKDGQGDYAIVPIPGPRPEALVVNPDRATELWIAFWGSGVYRTLDRGATWQLMGLKGSEVTSLAVDFKRKLAYASTGSGVFTLRFQ